MATLRSAVEDVDEVALGEAIGAAAVSLGFGPKDSAYGAAVGGGKL